MDAGGSSTDRPGEPDSADRRRLKAALFLLLCLQALQILLR